jgi:hypothetical protein
VSKRQRPPRANGAREPKVRDVFVARPFQGLSDEAEWVALRELVPAATAKLRLLPEYTEKYASARSPSRRCCRWRGRP